MDLEAVMMAFRTDVPGGGCGLFGGTGANASQVATYLKYIQFLNTDRDTGTFPSAQFLALSVLGEAGWALDPNMLAMGLELDKGCASPRPDTIRKNLLKLLDERIDWYSKDQSARIPLMQQTTTKIRQQDYKSWVEKDISLPAQEPVMRQIATLESRGAQLVHCEYGPTHPDSTGSQTFTLWFGNAPMTMNDFQKLSRNTLWETTAMTASAHALVRFWTGETRLGVPARRGLMRWISPRLPLPRCRWIV